MIPFERLTIEQKSTYDALLHRAAHRGCAFSFANLYLWGRQCAARVGDDLLLFSHFHGKTLYPYPICTGSARGAIELLIADSKERGIPLRLSGLNTQDVEDLERWYPGQFRFHCGRDGHEYVYAIDDLADLKGRKLQKKRNHLNRFRQEHPDAEILPLDESNRVAAFHLAEQWYEDRVAADPGHDYHLEHQALHRAFAFYSQLGMEGVVLMENGKILAFAMGSRLNHNTFDIHFEKALDAADGTYAAINRGFACYLREKYPDVKWLNREDDMGIEGLRKAKLSYCPDHMVEKCWAQLVEEDDAF